MKLPTLEDFKQRCENHEWMFANSDDYRCYKKGRKEEMAIATVVKLGGEDYYNIWRASAKSRRCPFSPFC